MASTTGEGLVRRPEKAKKQETLDKIAHLQSQIVVLEREKANRLYSKKHEFRDSFCALDEAEAKLSAQRKAERTELRERIEKIRNNVAGFKRLLTDVKPGPAFVEKLKQSLEEIEASILAFKEKQREVYESLLQAERVAAQEVTACERRLEVWQSVGTHPVASSAPTAVHGATTTGLEPTSMPPAVLNFERFLQQTGGRQGGWDDYDHQTFLKVRSKFTGQEGFIEAAARELPTKTREEIERHEQWYVEYCALQESKKTAIEAWRTHKETLRAERRAKAEHRDEHTSPQGRGRVGNLAQEREERMAKLKQWKAEQEVRRQQEEKQRHLEEAERARKLERERKRQEEARQRVCEAARQREEQRKTQEAEVEARRSREMAQRKAANREIHRFRERDLHVAEERKERARTKEMERVKSEQRLEKIKEQVEVHVSRDPSRLLKPTAGWQERMKAGSGSGIGGAVQSMPRRAIPSWRQGL